MISGRPFSVIVTFSSGSCSSDRPRPLPRTARPPPVIDIEKLDALAGTRR